MANIESVIVDTLELNSGNFTLEALEMPPPPKLLEWVRGADSDGALLARLALHENREVTARVRINQQADTDAALAQLGLLNDKLQEAERNQGGMACTWTPVDSTKTLTFYALAGEVVGLPILIDGSDAGWYVKSPVVTIRLICKPFLYGAEVVGSPASSTTSRPRGGSSSRTRPRRHDDLCGGALSRGGIRRARHPRCCSPRQR